VTEALAPFEFHDVRLVPPTRTFSGKLTLEVGGREVQLIEVGPAHTVGDLIVWVPDARIAIAADILFIGVTPIMWAGPVERWIAALERLLDLGAERFLPGHGPVCGPEEVSALLDYWRQARSATTRELADLSPWLAPERALVNVANLDGTAGPPGPRQLIPAFFRMALLARDLR
jgi:cyclase